MKLTTKYLIIFLLLFHSASTQRFHEYTPNPHLFSAEEPARKGTNRLLKPLIRDARVYTCSHNILYAFESNGTTVWSLKLNYTCNPEIAPIHGGFTTLYLVAENRVLRINPLHFGTPEPAVEVIFGPQPDAKEDEVIGIAVSTLSSSVFINVKYRGLFAYKLHGELIWTAGPVLYRNGYRQGCSKNWINCYFASAPVIDQCEASIYIANQEGELYALSTRSPYFKWVQDLSSFDKNFTVTPGNNGLLYVTVPVKTLVLALEASTGAVLWQRIIGPLSAADSAAVVDSNGWVSIGSLDGFLYSFSPSGDLKKFSRAANAVKSLVQVSPLVDCSGYAVYVSQTEVEGKMSQTIDEYTYISALKPTRTGFSLLVPATGSIYWSESYPDVGRFSPIPSESDLQRFILDEEILLAFVTASKIGNPLPCRSTRQKLSSSCSQGEPKHATVYTASEKAILLFLLFESALLVALVMAVRFCCIFWKKKKVQDQDLGKFLQKRRSLQLKKKAFSRTITELEQKAAEEATRNEALERLGDMVKEKEGIERKLSTTYSLGRDKTGPSPSSPSSSKSKSILPLYNRKTRSFSFQGSKKESVTIFHTLSDDTSSSTSSSSSADTSRSRSRSSQEELDVGAASRRFFEDKGSAVKAKGKSVIEVSSGSSEEYDFSDESDDESGGYRSSPNSAEASSSRGFMNPLFAENSTDGLREMKMDDDVEEVRETPLVSSRSIRRRTLSSKI